MLGKLLRLLFRNQDAPAASSPVAPVALDTAAVKVPIWPEEALAALPYSMHGVRLGATRAQVESLLGKELRKPTPCRWVWGDHDMNSVLFEGDRVREIWATALEKEGEVVLRQGDFSGSLAVLGDSFRTFGFMASTEHHFVCDVPPFMIDVTITTDAAIGSPEHEMVFGSDDVVGRVFHIGLRLEEL